MKNILITGADGQLGKALRSHVPHGYRAIAANRALLDIVNRNAVFEFFSKEEIAGVINAAAYTAVDKAEAEPALAHAINADGAENLGLAAREYDIPMVHVSTDFVFSGDQGSPYKPHDQRAPQSVYGHSKAKGEDAILAIPGSRSTILRTAWVYGGDGSNFVTSMLRLMQEKDSLGIVADQIGTPTHVDGLATACWFFLTSEQTGVFHWTDAGVASWYDFAVAIQDTAFETGALNKKIAINPIDSSEYPTAATRPSYSVLDKSSSWEKMGISPIHWRETLQDKLNSTNER